MLMAFEEPIDFDRMSRMPAHSTTARTGPPAMTPVPGDAGFSRTTAAESSPITSWMIVWPTIGTWKKLRFASSIPFWIAAGT